MRNIRDIVETSAAAYRNLDPHKLNNAFVTLQNYINSNILTGVGNNYKEPRMSKEKLRRAMKYKNAPTKPKTLQREARGNYKEHKCTRIQCKW